MTITVPLTGAGHAAEQFYHEVGPLVVQLRDEGMSLAGIAAELHRRGYRSLRGKKFDATRIRRFLQRCNQPECEE
jgi:hypothetical protein